MAEPMTFLELTNEAIKQAKVTLDPLTAANFSDPPRTRLYSDFKSWINDAYEELFLMPNNWQFKTARANVVVDPAVYVENVSGVLSAGDVLVGEDSNVSMTIVRTSTHESASNTLGEELTLYVSYDDPHTNQGLLQLGENLLLAGVAVATYAGVGTYDFASEIAGMEQLNINTLVMNKYPNDTYNGGYYTGHPVRFVKMDPNHPLPMVASQWAHVLTETPEGFYQFYPYLQERMLLSFSYSQTPVPMELAIDTPVYLPPRYHMYLVWKVVMEYADYDNKADVFRRAQKHHDRYENTLYADELEMPTLGGRWPHG